MTGPVSPTTSPPPRPPLALLIAMVMVGPVSIDIFLPSLPDMTRVFATDVSHVQLTMSIFIGGFALSQLILGPLSDRYGRRPVLLTGIILYLIASLASLAARSIETLILARLVQSFGACAGPVLSRAIVRDAYPRDQAARTLAMMASVFTIAPAVAPIFGGWLHTLFDWRANFVVMAVFGVVLFLGVWRWLAETNLHPDRHALKLSRMLGTYALLMGRRSFLGYTLTVSFVFAGMFCFVSIGSFVLIDVLGVRPEHFGFCFALVIIGLLSGNVITARLGHRFGMARMIGAGVVIGVLSGTILGGLALAHIQTIAAILAPMTGVFLAAGLVLPNATAAAIAPHGRIAGSASALLGFIQMAVAAGAGWMVGRLHDGTTLPMALTIALMLFIGAASFALLSDRKGGKRPESIG
ncbi:multidrug effflux MFS transporter [Telmatospirillum siberiense]|uniref:Bcr/CflA family efflux transporter n=1 Tax=Telmatospirillum siberiense TaxID=382514 RepID=A0A2N3PSM5_9PROT|nr:multidrug effflux MFS transporter [Telmatospirillum siberiense]PKU23376.1 Bcr/CflA family drug resistance efflux transporter [Telmatospirillum siberiense]